MAQLSVTDCYGRQVFDSSVTEGEQQIALATADYAPGLYWILPRDHTGRIAARTKVIVLH